LLIFLLACQGKEAESPGDSLESLPGWESIGMGLPSALLSIHGTSSTDVWTVGADVGAGPTVLHYDGSAWNSLSELSSGDLWWVEPVGSAIYIAGEAGRIIRVDRSTMSTQEWVVDSAVTLFGIWGSDEDHLIAVGGDLSAESGGAAAYQKVGDEWSLLDLPVEADARLALYKVWGTGADDVWIVGSDGLILQDSGGGFVAVSSPSDESLYTVHGAAGVTYAVGGHSSATILRTEGTSWVDDSPALAPQLNGIFVRSATEAVAVGNQGAIWVRDAAGWTEDSRHDPLYYDLHATWADDQGGLWAVGGHLSSAPLNEGFLLYFGTSAPPRL
jgi:hypothetical protein